MDKTLLILATAFALTSCADPKYLERSTGPTAKLVVVQVGKTNAFTYENNSPQRIMLLRVDEPTKTVTIPAGTPFPVRFAWNSTVRIGGISGYSISGCFPELEFIPQAGYTYTLQPGPNCKLLVSDQDGKIPPVAPINWKR